MKKIFSFSFINSPKKILNNGTMVTFLCFYPVLEIRFLTTMGVWIYFTLFSNKPCHTVDFHLHALVCHLSTGATLEIITHLGFILELEVSVPICSVSATWKYSAY